MSDIFEDYDMLVAVNQKTVNAQLARLAAGGAIPGSITLYRQDQHGTSTYKLVSQLSDVPAGCEYLDVQLQPQIMIAQSGTQVNLVLKFIGGTACLSNGAGPLAKLQHYDAAGWEYGLVVSLSLAETGAVDTRLPAPLQQQLANFQSAMFSVNSLFADLAAVTQEQFSSAVVKAGDQASTDALTFFMTFYIKSLIAAGSPYILGYTVAATTATSPSAIVVPDTLLPTASTFTLVKNDDPDLSCVVYALATRGCHNTVSGSPVNLPDGWGSDIATAQLWYAPAALTVPLLLKPIYDQLSAQTFANVSQNLDSIDAGSPWSSQITAASNGEWNFNISNQNSDDDNRYDNGFKANTVSAWQGNIIPLFQGGTQFGFPSWDEPPDGPGLTLNGSIYVFKQNTTSWGPFGNAQAWASSQINWSGKVTLSVGPDGALGIDSCLTGSNRNDHSGHNFGASLDEVLGDIANIAGSLVGGGGGSLGNVFSGLLQNTTIDKIWSLSSVFANLQGPATHTVMLPAGDVFKFGAIDCHPSGAISIDLDYL